MSLNLDVVVCLQDEIVERKAGKALLKDLLTFIPKKKRIYFIVLSAILLISMFLVIKFCDYPVWSFLPDIIQGLFTKKSNTDMTLYNLGISYIVSYIFYMLVSFMPEFLSYREEIEKRINLRAAIHREIQLFTVHHVILLESIFKVAVKSGKLDSNSFSSIEEVFTLKNIEIASSEINLSDDSDTMSMNKSYIDWYTKIVSEMRKEKVIGNGILTRYKSDIPTDIFYYIFYLINECTMFNHETLELFVSLAGKNVLFSNTMSFNTEEGRNIVETTCRCLIELVNWVNNEYIQLKDTNSPNRLTIYPIGLSLLKK